MYLRNVGKLEVIVSLRVGLFSSANMAVISNTGSHSESFRRVEAWVKGHGNEVFTYEYPSLGMSDTQNKHTLEISGSFFFLPPSTPKSNSLGGFE